MPIVVMLAKLIANNLIFVIQALLAVLEPVLSFFIDIISGIVDSIAGFIDWLWTYVETVLNAIIDGMNGVLKFLGFQTIAKLPKKAVDDAYAQGKDLGDSFNSGLNGEKKPTAETGAGTGTGTGTGQTGNAKKNPVVEFYKKMNDEIKQQKALTKLLSMGVSEDVANSIVSAGEGWEKIYSKVVKGGSKAIDGLESKFAQTAAGMAKIADTVKNTMQNVQQSIMDGFDLTKMGQSAAQIVGNARKMVDKAKKFGAEIVNLSKMGLNPTLLNQVIAAGPEQGMKLAQQLQASDVADLNSLYNQLGDTAMATGGQVAQNQVSYTIQVNGGIGDKNTIGKSIVEAIRAYERTSGVSWRSP
jgi:hypothetical protein